MFFKERVTFSWRNSKIHLELGMLKKSICVFCFRNSSASILSCVISSPAGVPHVLLMLVPLRDRLSLSWIHLDSTLSNSDWLESVWLNGRGNGEVVVHSSVQSTWKKSERLCDLANKGHGEILHIEMEVGPLMGYIIDDHQSWLISNTLWVKYHPSFPKYIIMIFIREISQVQHVLALFSDYLIVTCLGTYVGKGFI